LRVQQYNQIRIRLRCVKLISDDYITRINGLHGALAVATPACCSYFVARNKYYNSCNALSRVVTRRRSLPLKQTVDKSRPSRPEKTNGSPPTPNHHWSHNDHRARSFRTPRKPADNGQLTGPGVIVISRRRIYRISVRVTYCSGRRTSEKLNEQSRLSYFMYSSPYITKTARYPAVDPIRFVFERRTVGKKNTPDQIGIYIYS